MLSKKFTILWVVVLGILLVKLVSAAESPPTVAGTARTVVKHFIDSLEADEADPKSDEYHQTATEAMNFMVTGGTYGITDKRGWIGVERDRYVRLIELAAKATKNIVFSAFVSADPAHAAEVQRIYKTKRAAAGLLSKDEIVQFQEEADTELDERLKFLQKQLQPPIVSTLSLKTKFDYDQEMDLLTDYKTKKVPFMMRKTYAEHAAEQKALKEQERKAGLIVAAERKMEEAKGFAAQKAVQEQDVKFRQELRAQFNKLEADAKSKLISNYKNERLWQMLYLSQEGKNQEKEHDAATGAGVGYEAVYKGAGKKYLDIFSRGELRAIRSFLKNLDGNKAKYHVESIEIRLGTLNTPIPPEPADPTGEGKAAASERNKLVKLHDEALRNSLEKVLTTLGLAVPDSIKEATLEAAIVPAEAKTAGGVAAADH